MRLAVVALAATAFAAGAGACSGDAATPATPPPIATTTTLPPPTTVSMLDQDQFYVIRPGDVLSGIAQRFQVSQDELMELNGITDPSTISIGQVLELPNGAVLPTSVPASGPTSLATTTTSP